VKLSRASTANLTLLCNSDSPSSVDSPLDKNPGIVAYNYKKKIHKKTLYFGLQRYYFYFKYI
jgi:hypothetical protein